MTARPAPIPIVEEKKTEDPQTKPKSWGRRLAKILFLGSVALIVLLFVAELTWRFSGSNQLELALDQDGIKAYSLKAPGSEVVQFRAVGRIHSNLSGIVAWMKDPDACKIQGCTESHEIEHVSDQLQYNYFQYDFSPLGKREFMIESLFYQNPANKQVILTVTALADRVPRQDGFFRVTNMNNKWRMTPVGNGEVEVQIENNLDMGGFFTNVMFNTRRARGMHDILTHLEGWVNKAKYQNTKFDFIKENNSEPTHISQTTAP